MTSELTETESGLLVPTSALPPPEPVITSVINPFGILFPTTDIAQKFADRCVVRWQYFIGMMNVAPETQEANWRAYSYKGPGIVHDTKSPAYKLDGNDTKLSRVTEIKKHGDQGFAIINKGQK